MFTLKQLLGRCALSVVLLTAQQVVYNRAAPLQNDKQLKSETQLIPSVNGRNLYRAYCASCHGVEARGNGPAASALKAKIPDLTLISKRNCGVFPSERVSKIISGETSPVAHGSREMPIWGPIFHQVEADQDWGNVRLQELTRYLESIQRR